MRLFFPPSTVEGREVSKNPVPLKRWNENTWQVPLREKLKVADFLHCYKKEHSAEDLKRLTIQTQPLT